MNWSRVGKWSRQLFAVACVSLISCSGDVPFGLATGARGLILFTRYQRATEAEIWVMRADGSDARRLTTNTLFDGDAAWSPDGQQIVFTSTRHVIVYDPSEVAEIHVMNADGSNAQRLTDGEQSAWAPRWSPDGSQIAFHRGGRIFVMNADGSSLRALPPVGASYPDWSPDGTRIVFVMNAPPEVLFSLYIMNADGTNARPLGVDPSCAGFVVGGRWSPDTDRIIYSCEGPDGTLIYSIRPDGTDNMVVRAPRVLGLPVWSPEGRLIAFNSEESGNLDIYITFATGGSERRITSDEFDYVSDWGPAR